MRTACATANSVPKLTPAQLDKLVELHDRRGMTHRALGVRYGISEKKAFRVVKERRRQP